VQRLLTQGCDVDVRSYKSLTPLQLAVTHGHSDVVSTLLAAGANLEAADSWGASSLHVAAQYGHHAVVQQLLAAGANLEATTADGCTPLHAAALYGDHAVLQQLLAGGANLEAATLHINRTPLHFAAAAGRHEVVQQLLAAGARPDTAAADGRTALHHAAQAGELEMVQQLLASGANLAVVDASGNTVLHLAAAAGQVEVLQLLLDTWGQPAVPADVLMGAADHAGHHQQWEASVRLVKVMQQLHPAVVHQWLRTVANGPALAAMLDAWSTDVSSQDEQRAAVCKQAQELAAEKRAVQQLIVQMACMAKQTQMAVQQEIPAQAGLLSGPGMANKRQRGHK
jgi:hypothetical protein